MAEFDRYCDSTDTSDTTMVEDTGEDAADDSDLMFKDDGSMAKDGIMSVTLAEVADSATKQTGTATLTEKNGKVEVVVKVTPVQTAPQPAHIHVGSCPGVGAVAYPLTNLVNGTSTTMLDMTMADLKAKKPLAINIHKSADEVKIYTACGSL
jgi:Cu/Zn superoxide dismutase